MRIKYLRDNNQHPYGVFICCDVIGEEFVGWSLCDKHDQFTKKKAVQIAKERLVSVSSVDFSTVPKSIVNQFKDWIYENLVQYSLNFLRDDYKNNHSRGIMKLVNYKEQLAREVSYIEKCIVTMKMKE